MTRGLVAVDPKIRCRPYSRRDPAASEFQGFIGKLYGLASPYWIPTCWLGDAE